MDDMQSLYILPELHYYNFTDCVVLHNADRCCMLWEH